MVYCPHLATPEQRRQGRYIQLRSLAKGVVRWGQFKCISVQDETKRILLTHFTFGCLQMASH